MSVYASPAVESYIVQEAQEDDKKKKLVKKFISDTQKRIKNIASPRNQKYPNGSRVWVRSLEIHAHIKYTAYQAYGALNKKLYCIEIDGVEVIDWFDESELELR